MVASVDDVLDESELVQSLNQRRRVDGFLVYQRRVQHAIYTARHVLITTTTGVIESIAAAASQDRHDIHTTSTPELP